MRVSSTFGRSTDDGAGVLYNVEPHTTLYFQLEVMWRAVYVNIFCNKAAAQKRSFDVDVNFLHSSAVCKFH